MIQNRYSDICRLLDRYSDFLNGWRHDHGLTYVGAVVKICSKVRYERVQPFDLFSLSLNWVILHS